MIFAINKPKGPTSNDILNQIRKILGTKKVGHAGTLDPLASGVLVVGTGADTKRLAGIVKNEKEYIADIFLGATSTTDDAEGVLTPNESNPENLIPLIRANKGYKKEEVEAVASQFVGNIQQTPPIYSAVKVAGKEAYKYARGGKAVVLKPRPVEIKSIAVLEYDWPQLKLRVVTGSGVYIRSLARDLGEKLGCGAYLADLVRTRVGEFTLEKTIPIDDLERGVAYPPKGIRGAAPDSESGSAEWPEPAG